MTTTITLPSLADSSALPASRASWPSRLSSLLYGSAVYILFLGTFSYLVGFLAGAFVPKHVDSGTPGPLGSALLVNGALLALFALQHTVMARPAFKGRAARVLPAQLERTTFVLTTCLILAAMVWQWRPMPATVWHVEGAAAIALHALSALGWITVLASTFLIDHFELFGLRQVVRHALGRGTEAPRFRERALYKVVRHPLMLGFLIAFWSTPHMSAGRLFFALMCTGYILVGTRIEERTLIAIHGATYLDYRRRVPGILPRLRRAA